MNLQPLFPQFFDNNKKTNRLSDLRANQTDIWLKPRLPNDRLMAIANKAVHGKATPFTFATFFPQYFPSTSLNINTKLSS